MDVLTEFLAQLGPAFPLGPIMVASVCLMFAMRLYQRFGDAVLPQGARFENLPPVAKVVLPFLLALLGGVCAALASGTAVLPALAVALPGALGAIGLHHSTKAAGQVMHDAALKANPYYEPAPWRDAMSIVVPLPKIQPLHDLKP